MAQTTDEYWVSGRIVDHLLTWAAAAGLSRGELERAAGLTVPLEPSLHQRVPVAQQYRLWQFCADHFDPGFALQAGSRMAAQALPTVGPLIAVARDVRAALEHLASGSGQMSNAAITTFRQRPTDGGLQQKVLLEEHPPQATESALAHWAMMVRLLTGRSLTPAWVAFPFHKPRPAYHAAYFGTEIRYEAKAAALMYRDEDLSVPLLGHDPDAEEALRALLERRRSEELGPVSRRCRQHLLTDAPNARVALPQAAKSLGMSSRSLQRRLASEGIQFRTLVDAVMQERAMRLLRDPAESIDEVAHYLGYSRRSFCRAFTRWTGEAPGQWRQDAQPAGATGPNSGARRPGGGTRRR